MIGVITGSTIEKNRDGDIDRVVLQVEIAEDEVKTVELFTQAGEDTHPARDSRVVMLEIEDSYLVGISVSDDLTPTVNAGEKEFYSTDDPVTTKKAKIKLTSGEEIVLNDGTDYAVAYEDLKSAFDQLKSDFNSHIHTTTATIGVGPAVGVISPPTASSTADMSGAKVEKVRLP